MTVQYSASVSTARFFTLHRLMFRWRGSIWRLIWHELLAWFIMYGAISFTYRMLLNAEQKEFVIILLQLLIVSFL
jgi:hypothetical protein